MRKEEQGRQNVEILILRNLRVKIQRKKTVIGRPHTDPKGSPDGHINRSSYPSMEFLHPLMQ